MAHFEVAGRLELLRHREHAGGLLRAALLEDRQGLLEQVSPTERLRMIRAMLARETGLLSQLRAVPAPITSFAVEYSFN